MNPWICPRCQQVWAPWVQKCNCTPGGSFAAGTNSVPQYTFSDWCKCPSIVPGTVNGGYHICGKPVATQ